MIEIIQEENWDSTQERKGLPKNIKQIGTLDIGDRIYIENAAYQKMHPQGEHAEKMVYVMLGRFDDFAGNACIFVEDVVKMSEVEFNGRLPIWNEDSWGHLYRKLKPEHEDMIIVGWAVDICGQLPSMTAQLERMHQTYFGGAHQMLLVLDTLEQEEAFYCNKNGYLKRREGFYIYYDKTIPVHMEEAARVAKTGKDNAEEQQVQGDERAHQRQENYRDYLSRRKKSPAKKMPRLVYGGVYSSTLLLLLVITVLGYSAFWNHRKMETMEQALNEMNQINELHAVMQTEVENENMVKVEEIAGTVTETDSEQNLSSTQNAETTQDEELSQDAESSQGMTTSQNVESAQETNPSQNAETAQGEKLSQDAETAQDEKSATGIESSSQQITETAESTLSEAEVCLAQGYYVVQSGDSLAGICRRIYHTTAMLDKLCEINEIEDPDAIYAGQRLSLPN